MAFGDVVQTKTGSGEDTATVVLDSTPVEGSLLVVSARAGAGGGVGLDTPPGFTAGPAESASRGGIAMFAKIAGSSESTSITVDAADTAGVAVAVLEIEGPFDASPFDAEAVATSGNGSVSTQSTGTTPTTSDADEIAVACAGQILALNDITGWSNSYTDRAGIEADLSADTTIGVATLLLSSTGTQETTATFAGGSRAKGAIWTFVKGAGGTNYDEAPVFTAAAVLTVASALDHAETVEITAAASLAVVDVLNGGGTAYEEFPDIAAQGTLAVASTLTASDTPDIAAAGLLTILDVWSGDANLTPVVWRLEVALGVAGGAGGLWDTGQWDTTGVWGGSEPTWVPVTSELLSANPTAGRDAFEDRMRTSTMSIVLADETGEFNPDYGATPPGDLALRPGRLIRLSGNVGEGYVPVFRGSIDDMTEIYGPGGEDVNMRMSCVGYSADLALNDPPALGAPVGAGEATDDRVARVLDAFGWSEVRRDLQSGVHTMQATTLARSSLEEIQRAADAEGGAFYFDGAGVATFKAQGWLENDARSTTPQLYPGRGSAGDPSVIGVTTEWTRRTIINDAQYTRVGGTMQRETDLTSKSLYGGLRTARRTDLEVETDAQALTLAERIVEARAYDRLRVTGLSLSALDLASGRGLLELQLGDLVEATVTTLHGWGYTVQAHVMRITHVIVADDWVVELRVDDAVTYSPT